VNGCLNEGVKRAAAHLQNIYRRSGGTRRAWLLAWRIPATYQRACAWRQARIMALAARAWQYQSLTGKLAARKAANARRASHAAPGGAAQNPSVRL